MIKRNNQESEHTLVPGAVAWVCEAQGEDLAHGDVVLCNGQEYYRVALDDRLAQYWYKCLRFWSKAGRGMEPGPWVALRRHVVTHKQKTGEDLKEVYKALTAVPVLSSTVDLILSEQPSQKMLSTSAGELSACVDVAADGGVQYTMLCPKDGWVAWPTILGGDLSPGEQAREFRITVRYAKWRDRRLRRLVKIEVYAHEIWPRVP